MIRTGKNLGKIKNALLIVVLLLQSTFSLAAIQASIDRTEVPQDESVSLKISLTGNEGANPHFDAPDFEIMNQFQSSQFSAVYINGKFENKSERMITYILRPLKVGNLRIKNISNGNEKAPDLSVQVVQENNYKKTVPGNAPSLSGDNKNFFVKAEVSKLRAYKGEEMTVSFYLYRRTRATIRDVMQYPSFQGFIREDLEMPILSGRSDFEAVNLGGVPFERALLARYALYPIQEGKLKIDGLSIRADYIPKNAGNDDSFADPFFQFFSQVTPRTATSKSDPITIDVLPLPEDGRSSLFTGGVGNFEVSSEVDSNTAIKANSPMTVKVTVKGKGNASLIEFPQVSWPKEIKFFESQGKSKNLGQGVTEKTFDVVLIPLQKGDLEIPPIEFEFFNPESRGYIHRKTEPLHVFVAEGAPGSSPSLAEKSLEDSAPNPNATPGKEATSFGALRTKDHEKVDGTSSFLGQPWWRWVGWFGLLVFFCFVSLVIFDSAKKKSLARLEILKRRQNTDAFWSKLQREAQNLIISNAPVTQFSIVMEEVVDQLYKTLDDTFGITSRAHPKRELAMLLTENQGISQEQWNKIAHILDFSEMVRFASGSGSAPSSEIQAIPEMIAETQKLCGEISGKKL